MADLEFRHGVSQVPAGAELPSPYHRTVSAEVTPTNSMYGGISEYADASNWMSRIGSTVAAKASNAIATKLGAEMGRNPKGDLGIPLTEFDEVMQKSYKTQAQATLGLQANRLITESNIEMAKANRITPELIDKTNKNISMGLKNIFSNAPADIQPHLEYQFGNVQLGQMADLTERMLREQKTDRKNNTALASNMNAEHGYSFGLRGDEKAGLAAIENTRKLNEADVASRITDPQTAKTNVDTVRKSYLSGKVIHEYEKAKSDGKGEEYLKSLADKKPDDISDTDYMSVTNNLLAYVNHQDQLRNEDEQLRLAKFNVAITQNPMSPDMGSQLQDLKNNVTPVAFEKAQLNYINAVKTYNKEQGELTDASAVWNDPGAFSRLTEKAINRNFDNMTSKLYQQKADEGKPISMEEAEVQVASSAGGKIPVFQKSLENKLLSGNPQSIASASDQIEMLNHMEAGRTYEGISQRAKAIATMFQQQRGSMPDTDLARQLTDNLSNIDPTMQKTLDNSWNQILSVKGASGPGSNKSLAQFALSEVGLNDNELGGKYFGVIYGNDIYNQLNSNYIATRGDYSAAQKMTQDYVDNHYGRTYVNGEQQITDSPIEKYLGYKGNEVTPYIQKDLLDQLSVSFAKAKEEHPSDYWEIVPPKKQDSSLMGRFFSDTAPEVTRHVVTQNGVKEYRYPVNLVGRAGNQWDVVVKTPYGQRNLFLVAPHVGVTTYHPNKEAIDKDFSENKHKGFF